MIGNIEVRTNMTPETFALTGQKQRLDKTEDLNTVEYTTDGANHLLENTNAVLPEKADNLSFMIPEVHSPAELLEQKLAKEGMKLPVEQVMVYDVETDDKGLTHGRFIIAPKQLSSLD